MNTLPHINEKDRTLVAAAIDKLVERIKPEGIICYGVRTDSKRRWSCFTKSDEAEPSITLDVLVITHQTDKRHRDQVIDTIEGLGSEIRFVPVVHSIEAVKAGLKAGNPFHCKLYQCGIVLYEQQPIEVKLDSIFSENTTTTNRLGLAQSFYKAACDCATDENFETAMFLLHQSTELSCTELLKTRLGYKSNTHSLRRLFALSENITESVTEVFPSTTEEEARLFEMLQRAYVDVRYKEDYAVAPDDVFTLTERVSELLNRNEELCSVEDTETDDMVSKEEDTIPGFESISIDTSADIILQQGEAPDISIDTDGEAEIFQHAVKEKRLFLSLAKNLNNAVPPAVIRVTYVSLTGLVVDDCGTLTCEEPIEAESLGIVQNGKGKVDLSIAVSKLDAAITKSGTLRLSGTADRAKVLNTGPGDFDGSDLEVSEAEVTIKDSGIISICVSDELKANLRGDGKLNLKGEPRLKKFTMTQ